MRVILGIFAVIPLWGQGFLKDALPLANNQANQLFEQQNYEEALKSYLDLYSQDTENGALAYNIANTYQILGDKEKAAQFYKKALSSDHSEARSNSDFNMGYMRLKEQDLSNAIDHYVSYLRQNPNDEDAKRNLEIALRQLQQQQQQQQQQGQDSPEDHDQQQNQDSSSDQDQSQDQDAQQPQDSQDSSSQEQDSDQQSSPDQPSDQQDQSQNKDQQDSQQQRDQTDQNQEDQSQQPQEQDWDEETKQQILQALQEQEADQQKLHQQRKTGRVKRRAKDW